MSLLESSWFLLSSLIIIITLVVDPKGSQVGSGTGPFLGLFSNRSSSQQFIYQFSGLLILMFFALTTILSLSS